MSRTAGAAGSLLVHAALLLAFLPGQPAAQSQGVPAVRQDKGNDDHMRLLPSEQEAGDGLSCSNSYRGVGVMHGFSGYVIEVAPGSPADRAGLKTGDWWLNTDAFSRDQYDLGHPLTIRIERDGQRMDLSVQVGRICYQEDRE